MMGRKVKENVFRWISRHGRSLCKAMNSFGFIIVTAVSHQGTEEECTFLSGRILLFVSLLAGKRQRQRQRERQRERQRDIEKERKKR